MTRVNDERPVGGIPIPQNKLQQFVWARLGKARHELKSAFDLERLIEQRRIDAAKVREANDDISFESAEFMPDPLGGRIAKLIEELNDILD